VENEKDVDGYSELTKRCFLGKQHKPKRYTQTANLLKIF